VETVIRNLKARAKGFNYESICFPAQLDLIKDPSKLKAAFCTRRAAKSYTGGIYLVKECLENPGCNCLFLGLTRQTYMGIIWKDILKDLNKRYGLNISFNESSLMATFPNGSVIYVTGVDADGDEMNKLLGKKYRLVVLDEASMFSIDQRQLVYGILKPAMADWRGTICMTGTAANETQTLFYDVTKTDGAREPGWSVHEWNALDNPYVAVQWKEELEEISKIRPEFKETPLFKQWYLNQWVIDDEALVYKYNANRNRASGLPYDLSDWHYVLGIDLAHSPDSTAFTVNCYHPADKSMYVVLAEKYQKMDFTDVALKIKEFEKKYSFDAKICDGANKQGIAEMNNRHMSGLIVTEKMGKVEYINMFNGDLIQGRIKALPSCEELIKEWKSLVWKTEAGKVVLPRKEHDGIHNDLADSCLYAWRHCYNFLWHPMEKKPLWGTLEQWQPGHIEKLTEQVRREQNPNDLEVSWNEVWEEDDDPGKAFAPSEI